MNNHTIRRMLMKTFMRQWRFNGQKVFKIFIKDSSPSSGSSLSTWANRGCYKGIVLEEPPSRDNVDSERASYMYLIKSDFEEVVNLSPTDSSFNLLYGSTTALFLDMSTGVSYRPFSVGSSGSYLYSLFRSCVPVQNSLIKIRLMPAPLTDIAITGISAALLDGCDINLAPAQSAPTSAGSGMVLFAGGMDGSTSSYYQDITKYVIGSNNTAASFGRLLDQSHMGSATGQTGGRGLFIGGCYTMFSTSTNPRGAIEDINYITFSTASNTSYFAQLVLAMYYTAAASNGDKVCIVGGAANRLYNSAYLDEAKDFIQYTSINTPVNCNQFSSITDVKQTACTSNGKLDVALYAGGRYTSVPTNPFDTLQDYAVSTMRRVTISTKTVSSVIGNLTQATFDAAMVSNGAGNTAVLVAGRCDTATANIMEYITIPTGTSMSAFGICDAGQATAGSNGSGNKAVFRQQGSISTITINTPANATAFATITASQYSMCNQDKID